ncbi:hypothetical protein D1872_303410 [compost metagenome]
MNPTLFDNSISLSLKPPSGPISSAICGVAFSRTLIWSLFGASTSLVMGNSVASQSANASGAKISGTRFMPHCSHAAMAIPCQ